MQEWCEEAKRFLKPEFQVWQIEMLNLLLLLSLWLFYSHPFLSTLLPFSSCHLLVHWPKRSCSDLECLYMLMSTNLNICKYRYPTVLSVCSEINHIITGCRRIDHIILRYVQKASLAFGGEVKQLEGLTANVQSSVSFIFMTLENWDLFTSHTVTLCPNFFPMPL